MAQLKDTTITGDLILNGLNVQEELESIKSVLNQNDQTKVILPGGLKLYTGKSVVSSNSDPSGTYSVKITFDEPFQSSDSYVFFCINRLNIANTGPTSISVYPYYQRTNEYIWVGSKVRSCQFDWLAFGI